MGIVRSTDCLPRRAWETVVTSVIEVLAVAVSHAERGIQSNISVSHALRGRQSNISDSHALRGNQLLMMKTYPALGRQGFSNFPFTRYPRQDHWEISFYSMYQNLIGCSGSKIAVPLVTLTVQVREAGVGSSSSKSIWPLPSTSFPAFTWK